MGATTTKSHRPDDSPSGRTALFLYVLLVVLPAACFGGLLWRQLQQYQDRLLSELPVECRNAADRLKEACAERVEALIYEESLRPFEHYGKVYFADGLGPIKALPSPLASGSSPPGVLAYFSFRLTAGAFLPSQPTKVTVLRGSLGEQPDGITAEVERIVRTELIGPNPVDPFAASRDLKAAIELEGNGEVRTRLVRSVVLNVAEGEMSECQEALENSRLLSADEPHNMYVQVFDLRRIDSGSSKLPWVLAERRVTTDILYDQSLPTCIDAVRRPVLISQGFMFDPEWLHTEMPEELSRRVLGPSLRLALPGEPMEAGEGRTIAEADFLGAMGLTGRQPIPPDQRLRVVSDASQLRREFRGQNAWFGGMAAILTISMMIGIRLLLASIRASRMEAQRTRNFVASVTHELRTPIAAVKLYGEMLKDGWVTDEVRRDEYLGRIVHESDRLGGLVDRVLLRRRLFDQAHSPTLGDLNAEIERQRADLEMVGGREGNDLEFELADGLPPVLLLPEGVHVVLQNLVENARKYAPVPVGPDGEATGERILVRTRLSDKRRVLLEVLDRGPGIPEKDRGRVFEAFLRLGDEQTRQTKGTGLGLHLVALQAKAMKGRVRALPRAGGGTVFEVTLSR